MTEYTTITTELKAKIRSAWGSTFKVSLGRPKVPFKTRPYATILNESVTNVESGRTLRRRWRFEIIGVFDFDADQDTEVLAFGKIDLLHQQLQPYSAVSVPVVPGPFAGICDVWQVEEFSPIEEEIEDAFYGIRMVFSCETEVYS